MLYIRRCWCADDKNFIQFFIFHGKSFWITGWVIGLVEIGILQAQLFVLQYWRSWLYFEITFKASKLNYIFPRWNRTVSMDTSRIIRKIGTTNIFFNFPQFCERVTNFESINRHKICTRRAIVATYFHLYLFSKNISRNVKKIEIIDCEKCDSCIEQNLKKLNYWIKFAIYLIYYYTKTVQFDWIFYYKFNRKSQFNYFLL